jgi:hypothetical protein
MKLENLWVMLSALLAMLSLRLRKWLKRPQKLDVSYQVGNGTSKTSLIISSSNEEIGKED